LERPLYTSFQIAGLAGEHYTTHSGRKGGLSEIIGGGGGGTIIQVRQRRRSRTRAVVGEGKLKIGRVGKICVNGSAGQLAPYWAVSKLGVFVKEEKGNQESPQIRKKRDRTTQVRMKDFSWD